MNLFWTLFFPFVVLGLVVAAYLATRLKFFSSAARNLQDVLSEVKECDIESFQKLLSGAADEYLASQYPRLNFRQRQEAAHKRFAVTRQGLEVIISNAALFQEVARFHSRHICAIDPDQLTEGDQLVLRTFDCAVICHFIAALAFAKLQVLEFCHVAWPWYIPALCGLGDAGKHSLFTSYKSLTSSILEFARLDRRDWIYDNLLFALTGLIECNEDVFD